MSDPLKRAAGEAARYLDALEERPVVGGARVADLERHLRAVYRFEEPSGSDAVLDDVARMLGRGGVHGGHPSYFGPFHPGVHRSAAAASTLVAAVNPQMAARSHATAAIAIEAHVLSFLTSTLGFAEGAASASFTSGGQEGNTEAIVLALARAFPSYRDEGLRSLTGEPVFYVSDEAHHSFDKAATIVGLGRAAVRRVGVDGSHRIDVARLRRAIEADRRGGARPFLVVGTAGTTAAGAIDPLDTLADLAEDEGLAFHCDAAYGGALAFSPARRAFLRGIERADSVTWDAHKWLGMPLGTSMFFTRHPSSLVETFSTSARYMPRARDDAPDPSQTGLAWSRRAAGIPLFVALAVLGKDAFTGLVDRTCEGADALRTMLVARGFALRNESSLPVVCFSHERVAHDERAFAAFAGRLRANERLFAPPVTFADGTRAIRAVIGSARTKADDLEGLVRACEAALG